MLWGQFGCVSARRFFLELRKILASAPGGRHTKPPVSLEGQLIWREFFYTCSAFTPNYGRMVQPPVLTQRARCASILRCSCRFATRACGRRQREMPSLADGGRWREAAEAEGNARPGPRVFGP